VNRYIHSLRISYTKTRDDLDLDDIDSLIDEAGDTPDETPADALVEESDDFDLDDIDGLIDEVEDSPAAEVATDNDTERDIDSALADSVEELADAQSDFNEDDIETLASSLIDEPELEEEPEL
ncbi:hypothetical protein CWC17_19025, partial [Pseudoalteromonas sp. S3785]|uniref:hypothetical protein n=1 Tax=Pseudoalteromonas sp. S3785 TaxID=579545 RepID=UPI00110B1B86